MNDNFLFTPDPESPIGMPITLWDPDTGRQIEAVVASDGFSVDVSAGDIDVLPGVSFYVFNEDRVVFGYLVGIGDIDSDGQGGIHAQEDIFPQFMSRHEAPLSVHDYEAQLERALNSGRYIVAKGLHL